MKKILLLGVILSVLLLSGCVVNKTVNNKIPTSTLMRNNEKKDVVTTTIATTTKAATTTVKIPSSSKQFTVSAAKVKIQFPNDYTIATSTEKNRRGSFISYEFSKKGSYPLLQEIQFFSKGSIDQFIKNCGNDVCFYGDYPTAARYKGQKEALVNKKDYTENSTEYKLKQFGDRYYFTYNSKASGDSAYLREYTTFVGDTKIDVWITMGNTLQTTEADKLFASFKIIE